MDILLTLLLFIAVVGLAVMVGMLYYTVQQQQANANRGSRPAAAPSVPASPPSNVSRSETLDYRTQDGADYFRFSFEPQPGGTWRVYIVAHPSYGGRADDAHTTHRLSDGARKYVCWTDPLRTIEQAKEVARMWAEATQKYVRNGTRF